MTAKYGQPVTVSSEFLAKANTYYDKNLIEEPFALKVTAVNGKKLPEAVVIEYRLDQVNMPDRPRWERTGVVTEFEAYESLYESPVASPWLVEMEQGMPFSLFHVLHIRPIQEKST